MLECEHGDHPDYKFPILVEWKGVDPNLTKAEFENGGYYQERHALLYCDGFVALTLHECCYHIWSCSSGKELRRPREREYQQITENSLEEIRNKFKHV